MRFPSIRRPALAALACAALIVAAGCTRSASAPSPTAAPAAGLGSPAPSVSALPVPRVTLATAPAATPDPGVLPSVRPAAPQGERTPAPRKVVAVAPRTRGPSVSATPFGILRPHDAPQIYAVNLSTSSAGGGDVVTGTVATSSNVASVVASVAGITAGVPKTGVGRFTMSYRLPSIIPPFVKGAYTIVVTARNVDGKTASSSVPITLH